MLLLEFGLARFHRGKVVLDGVLPYAFGSTENPFVLFVVDDGRFPGDELVPENALVDHGVWVLVDVINAQIPCFPEGSQPVVEPPPLLVGWKHTDDPGSHDGLVGGREVNRCRLPIQPLRVLVLDLLPRFLPRFAVFCFFFVVIEHRSVGWRTRERWT